MPRKISILALALGLTVALVVTNYFTGYVKTTFASAGAPISPNANITPPIGFVLAGDQPYEVSQSITKQDDIRAYYYLYRWHHDGQAQIDDDEPIFVYYQGSSNIPFAVAERIHFEWRVNYNNIAMNNTSVVLTFLTDSHTPTVNYPLVAGYEIVTTPITNGRVPTMINPFALINPTETLTRGISYGATAGLTVFIITTIALRKK